MTTPRARLVALPLVAALIVAVAVGAAAHSSAQDGPVDHQASIEAATVVLTLLGMALLVAIGVFVWALLTSDRGRGGKAQGPHTSLRYQLLVSAIALAVIGGLAALLLLLPSGAHPSGGGAGRAALRTPPPSKALPYDAGVGGITAGSVAAVVVALATWYWLRRRVGRRSRPAFLTELPGTAGDLTGDVLAGLRAQLATVEVADPRAEPDPRRAVIAAWSAMTDVIAVRWRAREPSETPFEYLHAALTGAGVGPGSAVRLTSLFEEARWGARPVGEEMRTDAIAALDAVRAELHASRLEGPGLAVAG